MFRAIRFFVGSTLLVSAGVVQAFPTQQAVPGGLVMLPLASQNESMPTAYYAGARVTVVPHNNHWVAWVGIPLDVEPGWQQLDINLGGVQQTLSFQVQAKHYRTQRLRIKDKNKVEPDEASSERIVQEMALQQRLTKHYVGQVSSTEFIRPLAGRDSGRFGLRRLLNGQQRQPHSGMDIAAATGTPVKLVAPGRVIYTGNLFFSGNVIYVDHGGGLISMYAHLNQIKVKNGEVLQQGDYLGTVGSTGRATGSHLHWSMYLNGTAINPALFL